MENNWKDRAKEILEECSGLSTDEENNRCYYAWEIYDAMEESMNLVFEATKKECANKAEVEQHDRISIFVDKMIQDENSLYKYYANEESILNINKPNL